MARSLLTFLVGFPAFCNARQVAGSGGSFRSFLDISRVSQPAHAAVPSDLAAAAGSSAALPFSPVGPPSTYFTAGTSDPIDNVYSTPGDLFASPTRGTDPSLAAEAATLPYASYLPCPSEAQADAAAFTAYPQQDAMQVEVPMPSVPGPCPSPDSVTPPTVAESASLAASAADAAGETKAAKAAKAAEAAAKAQEAADAAAEAAAQARREADRYGSEDEAEGGEDAVQDESASNVPLLESPAYASRKVIPVPAPMVDPAAPTRNLEVRKPTPAPQPAARAVKIEVYYETMCPACKYMLTNQLGAMYIQDASIPDYIDLRLYPFGNSAVSSAQEPYTFQCQHGDEECWGNKLHNCMVKYLRDPRIYVPLAVCIAYNDQMPMANAFQLCAQSQNINPDVLTQCSESDQASAEMYATYQKTAALNPQLQHTPWILINGVHTPEAENGYLVDIVCSLISRALMAPGGAGFGAVPQTCLGRAVLSSSSSPVLRRTGNNFLEVKAPPPCERVGFNSSSI